VELVSVGNEAEEKQSLLAVEQPTDPVTVDTHRD